MCEEYNGWINRETWATALYLNNDYGLYITAQDLVNEAIMSNDEEEGKPCLTCLAESLEALFDDAFSDIEEMTHEGLNMLKDIGSLYRVNWYEIAKSLQVEVLA